MTCCAIGILDRPVPNIPGRLVRLVAAKTVLKLKPWGMLFMAIQARIRFTLAKSVGMMAVSAILVGMRAGPFCHLLVHISMTGYTDWFCLSKLSKAGHKWGMGIVARSTILGRKVNALTRVMTLGTLGNNGLALWRMPFMTIHAGNLCTMGRFLASHGLDHLEVALDTITLAQLQRFYLRLRKHG